MMRVALVPVMTLTAFQHFHNGPLVVAVVVAVAGVSVAGVVVAVAGIAVAGVVVAPFS